MTYRARCEGRRASKRYRSSHRAMLLGLVREMTSGNEFPELSSVDMSGWVIVGFPSNEKTEALRSSMRATVASLESNEEWDQ